MSNHPHAQTGGGQSEDWLTGLVARTLGIHVSRLDTRAPLSGYGLDSISTVSLMTSIADATGLALDESILFDYPTISQLAGYLESRTRVAGESACTAGGHAALQALMQQDGRLPEEIRPPAGETARRPAVILLTGATGFLGAHLLETLLGSTTARILCLIRTPAGVSPRERLTATLSRYGLDAPDLESRVTVIAGDIGRPRLGLSRKAYDEMAHQVDAVYHSAADVNWGLDYAGLRDTNVLPMIELLQLCCTVRKKAFVFVSSISACYAYGGPDTVTEKTPVQPLLEGIHLGYAQSKVVAEALCGQALARGLPVMIHRPALILGNSRTGCSNTDDLVSRVIKGCVLMGCAPDLDWPFDACPVDDVARVIGTFSPTDDDALPVTHLIHPRPRHWREVVLWMNVYGYRVELLPYAQWADRLREACRSADHPLYPLRLFFLRRLAGAGDLTLPEIYEEKRRSRVTAMQTSAALDGASLAYEPLDSALLSRYFGVFAQDGYLPQAPDASGQHSRDIATVLDEPFFSTLSHAVFGDSGDRAVDFEKMPLPADSSIIADLASWKFGKPSGLYRYRASHKAGGARELFIKVKSDDRAVLDVAATVAELSAKGLGGLFSAYERQTGLAGCHKRELAVYRQDDPRFVRHVPRPCVLVDQDEAGRWIIALEAIERPLFMDARAVAPRWPARHIISCIDGIAELHAIWLGRETELVQRMPLCEALTADEMENARPLWRAIAEHADSFMKSTTGVTLNSLRLDLADSVHSWWSDGERLDRTLIHNDFNPRNLAIDGRQHEPVLRVFDWELATLGLPQRDLAEFLCFALPPDHERAEGLHYIEHHRRMLERATGIAIDRNDWAYGFRLALFELAINRIPMYTLVHRIKPQRFLERMVQTWHALFRAHGHAGRMR
jgi:thioester reductase-like protein